MNSHQRKASRLASKIILILFVLFMLGEESYSLTDYKIKKICKKEKKVALCIRNLQEKRFILQKGKHIEIPVIPYKG